MVHSQLSVFSGNWPWLRTTGSFQVTSVSGVSLHPAIDQHRGSKVQHSPNSGHLWEAIPAQTSPWSPQGRLLGQHYSSASFSVSSCFLSLSATVMGSQEHSFTNVWQANLELRVDFRGKPSCRSLCQECSKKQMLMRNFGIICPTGVWQGDCEVNQAVVQDAASGPDVIIFARIE